MSLPPPLPLPGNAPDNYAAIAPRGCTSRASLAKKYLIKSVKPTLRPVLVANTREYSFIMTWQRATEDRELTENAGRLRRFLNDDGKTAIHVPICGHLIRMQRTRADGQVGLWTCRGISREWPVPLTTFDKRSGQSPRISNLLAR
jgi:hypothetical protein